MEKEILVIGDKQVLSPIVKREITDSIKRRDKNNRKIVFTDSMNQQLIIDLSIKSNIVVFYKGVSCSQIIEICKLIIDQYSIEKNCHLPIFISIKKTRWADFQRNKIIVLKNMDLVGVFV